MQSVVVSVTPKAAWNRIEAGSGEEGAPDYRVWVTAAPLRGRANSAVLRLLSKRLGVPKSALAIIRGETARLKTVRVER